MSVDNFYLKFRFEPFNNFLQLLCIVHISFYTSLEREGGGLILQSGLSNL